MHRNIWVSSPSSSRQLAAGTSHSLQTKPFSSVCGYRGDRKPHIESSASLFTVPTALQFRKRFSWWRRGTPSSLRAGTWQCDTTASNYLRYYANVRHCLPRCSPPTRTQPLLRDWIPIWQWVAVLLLTCKRAQPFEWHYKVEKHDLLSHGWREDVVR